MTYAELVNQEPPRELPKLSRDDYSLLWYSGYWDGPIDGMLEFAGREYWFGMIQENESWEKGSWYRRFAVVSISLEQLAHERLVHADFRKYVGTHTDYITEAGAGAVRSNEQSHLFYDMHSDYCRSQPFNSCDVVAWFEN